MATTTRPPALAGGTNRTDAEQAELLREGRRRSTAYLIVMIGIVAIAVGLLEWAYSMAPIPPGGDTGRWVATSFAYIGWPYPSPGSFANPYSYSPVTFPLLGIAVLATESPETGAMVFGGALLAAYGLSTIYMARRYLLVPTFQLALVLLAVYNLTTISMLFWGGMPNFLGFVFMILAIVFLLDFVRTKSLFSSVLLWGALSALYLTHDLTFAIALGAVALAGLVLLVHRRISWRLIVGLPNLIGMALLGATIVGYIEVSKYLRVPHPGYLFSNPPAYILTPINLVFRPLTIGFTSPLDFLPTFAVLAILIAVPVALLLGLYYVRKVRMAQAFQVPVPKPEGGFTIRWVRPTFVNDRLLIVSAWVSAACLVPAVGWFVHIDTDYTRFAYFFTLPILVFLILLLEQTVYPWLARYVTPIVSSATPPPRTPTPAVPESAWTPPTSMATPPVPLGSRVARFLTVAGVVIIGLILVAQVYNFDQRTEGVYAGSEASPVFFSTLEWIRNSGPPGSVLTPDGHSAHWVEAVDARDAYFPGPTWENFYPSQVLRDEEAYWSLNTQYAISNNNVVVSYSGVGDTVLREMPMYSAYFEGVQFPILRIQPGGMVVTTLNASQAGNHSITSVAQPTAIHFTNSTPPQAQMSFSTYSLAGPNSSSINTNNRVNVTEVDALGSGGQAWFNFTVTPESGWEVGTFSFNVTQPAGGVEQLHFGRLASRSGADWGFTWNTSGPYGDLPGRFATYTTGLLSTPASSYATVGSGNVPLGYRFAFTNPNPSQPLSVSLELITPGTSNPTVTFPAYFSTIGFFASVGISTVLDQNPTPKPSGKIASDTVQMYLTDQFGAGIPDSNGNWTVLTVP